MNIKVARHAICAIAMCTGLLSLATKPADAAVIFVFENTSVAGLPSGQINYLYDIDLQSTTDAGTGQPTDLFTAGGSTFGTLYDIQGFVSATLTAGDPFTLSTQGIGITPGGTAPGDDPGLTNVTLTYTGATSTSSISYSLALTVDSTGSVLNPSGQYTGQDIKNTGAASGTDLGNIGNVAVPSAVPEPASLFSFAGGAALLLFGGLRRRKSNS